MVPKRFADIEKADIDVLLTNEVSEGRTLEYKEKLPGNGSDDRKEFLADVIAFANATGGDLLFGVCERRDAQGKPTGLPEAIPGLADINADNEILRLESMLRESIEPRLPSVQMRAIAGFAGPVIIIRIAQSWTAPHRSRQDRHFYSRTSAGKYPMDVGEIRSAFALSSTLAESVRHFRDGRLARIIAGETPVPLGDGACMVLHLIPQSSMMASTTVNIQPFIRNDNDRQFLRPMRSGGWSGRYNYEGYTSYSDFSYAQLFRSTAVEFATGDIAGTEQAALFLPAAVVTQELIESVRLGLQVLQKLETVLPVFVQVSFINVLNHKLAADYRWTRIHSIDRNMLVLPDVMVSDWNIEAHLLLQPIFDTLWQTVGYPRCTYYDGDSSWTGPSYR